MFELFGPSVCSFVADISPGGRFSETSKGLWGQKRVVKARPEDRRDEGNAQKNIF